MLYQSTFFVALTMASLAALASDPFKLSHSPYVRSRKHLKRAPHIVREVEDECEDGETALKLVDSFNDKDFINPDMWSYWDKDDPTHGNVDYLNVNRALDAKLVSVGNVTTFRVDATSRLSGEFPRRPSVRLSSVKAYKKVLIILDATKMPFGCGVWPAFWTVGSERHWPLGGEIDIVEGVHDQVGNRATLHTSAGCTLNRRANFTGQVLDGGNCDVAATGNSGCGIKDTDPKSYGQGFNDNGGGVYAMKWDDLGIRIWFFPRQSIPEDITNSAPHPSTWGTPVNYWSNDSCGDKFFDPQNIIFDITLCGDWAGATFGGAGCPAKSCAEYVKDPSHFKNAEWGVKSVEVYE